MNKNKPETYHELFHGTTKHGAQRPVGKLSRYTVDLLQPPRSEIGAAFKS